MKLDERLYNQYIMRFSSSARLDDITNRIAMLDIGQNVFIRNLSNVSYKEALAEINLSMTAEKSRCMDDGDSYYFINIYRTPKNDFIVILSVATYILRHDIDRINEICSTLFGFASVEASVWHKSEYADSKNSVAYWRDAFASVNPAALKMVPRAGENIVMESFGVDEDISKVLGEQYANEFDPRSICNTVIGSFNAEIAGSSTVLINSIVDSAMLSGAPVLYKKMSSVKKELESVQRQIDNSHKYNTCTYSQLYRSIGNRYLNRVSASVYYVDDLSNIEFLEHMHSGVLYLQPAIESLEASIIFFFRFFSGKLTISYLYDADALKNVDMSKLNNVIEGKLRMYMHMKPKTEDKEIENTGEDIAENKETADATFFVTPSDVTTEVDRIGDIKKSLLKRHSIGKTLKDSEIQELSSKCQLIHKNMQQNIVLRGQKFTKLYLVCSGKVEMLGKSMDDYFNPVYIARGHDIIGVEGLSSNCISDLTCKAITDDVIVMAIEVSDFEPMVYSHPEIVKYLLTVQTKRIHTLEKLWLMA